jgi:hypothetical protein
MNFFVFIARKRWEIVATLWVGEREDALWEEESVAHVDFDLPCGWLYE